MLPDQVKRVLHVSTQMDDLSIVQLLACTQTIIKDEMMEADMAVAAVPKHEMKQGNFHVIPYHVVTAMVLIILQKATHWKVEN